MGFGFRRGSIEWEGVIRPFTQLIPPRVPPETKDPMMECLTGHIYTYIYIFIFVSDPCVNGSFPHHLQSNRSMLHLPKILMWYLVHPIFVIFWALGMGCTTRIGFFSSKVILTYGCSRMAAALILLVPLVNLRSIVGEFCWGESYGHCSTHIFLVFGVLCLLTFILFFFRHGWIIPGFEVGTHVIQPISHQLSRSEPKIVLGSTADCGISLQDASGILHAHHWRHEFDPCDARSWFIRDALLEHDGSSTPQLRA